MSNNYAIIADSSDLAIGTVSKTAENSYDRVHVAVNTGMALKSATPKLKKIHQPRVLIFANADNVNFPELFQWIQGVIKLGLNEEIFLALYGASKIPKPAKTDGDSTEAATASPVQAQKLNADDISGLTSTCTIQDLCEKLGDKVPMFKYSKEQITKLKAFIVETAGNVKA